MTLNEYNCIYITHKQYNLNVIIVYIHYYKSNLFGGLILCLGLWLIFMLQLLTRLYSLFTH